MSFIDTKLVLRARQALALVIFNLSFAQVAYAIGIEKGEVSGSLDTTLTYGLSARVQKRDNDLVGVANGGSGYSVNIDDGNLNYDSGDLFSNVVRFTSELELSYKNLGFFGRTTGLYDFEVEHGDTARTDLSPEAKSKVGTRIRLLDLYGWYNFEIGESPGEIRVGNQVLSWGESTFIPNGINTINPVNVNALRAPGSELKEALEPVPMVVLNFATTENTSVEAFYQWSWRQVEIDPPGTFFSANDFAGKGGDRVMLGRGTYSDGAQPNGSFAPVEDTFQAVPRAGTREASNTPQFGVALRAFVPKLNDTEFGFYFFNNHSRLPIVSGVTGTAEGALAAQRIAGSPNQPGTGALVAGAVLQALGQGATTEQAVQAGIQAGQALGQTENQATVIATTTAAEQTANEVVAGAVADAAIDAFGRTSFYRNEYPENIKTFGASFNTTLGTTGIAWQGEFSYRMDVPAQINTIEILGAVLGAADPNAAQVNQVGNFFGQFQTSVPGFEEIDILQFQSTASKIFGPTFGSSEAVLVGEIGLAHVTDFPKRNKGGPNGRGLRLNAPNTGLGGNPDLVPTANQPFAGQFLDKSHFASATSWGYQIRGQLTYNNAIGPINLFPRLAWRHDVDGITPGPGETFRQSRKAISIGLAASYLNDWRMDMSYTNFFGADRFNDLNDRDFFTFSLSYSF